MSSLLNEVAIVLMASGGPDLETLARRGDAALNAHLETLEKPNLGAGKSGAPVCATGRISGPSMSLIRKFMWILK
jgi:hypothetical protein